jgi:hypothetical protein
MTWICTIDPDVMMDRLLQDIQCFRLLPWSRIDPGGVPLAQVGLSFKSQMELILPLVGLCLCLPTPALLGLSQAFHLHNADP